jgi:hypothetical protein
VTAKVGQPLIAGLVLGERAERDGERICDGAGQSLSFRGSALVAMQT